MELDSEERLECYTKAINVLPWVKKLERVGMGFPTVVAVADWEFDSTVLGGTGERFNPSGEPTGDGASSNFSISLVCTLARKRKSV